MANEWVQTTNGTIEFKIGNPGQEQDHVVTMEGVRLPSIVAKHAVESHDRVVYMFEPGEEPEWDHDHDELSHHHSHDTPPHSHEEPEDDSDTVSEATEAPGEVSEANSGSEGGEGGSDADDVNDGTSNFNEGAASPGPEREVETRAQNNPGTANVCPTCQAAVGQPCMTEGGNVASDSHVARATAHLSDPSNPSGNDIS